MRRRTRHLPYLFAAVAASTLVATACGSSGRSSGSGTATASNGASSSASSSANANLAQFQQAVNTYYQGQVTAPPATAPKYGKPVNAWIISCGQASEGCADPTAAMKAAATALGWKTTVVDGNFGAADAYRVNTIAPGLIQTAATRAAGATSGALAQTIVARTLLGRLGRPDDVAMCAVWLGSDESSWVTGANIPIDGGVTAA